MAGWQVPAAAPFQLKLFKFSLYIGLRHETSTHRRYSTSSRSRACEHLYSALLAAYLPVAEDLKLIGTQLR